MAYISFGNTEKSTGALQRAGVSTQNKIMDIKIQGVEDQYNQALLQNKGVDPNGSFSQSTYDQLTAMGSDPSLDPTVRLKAVTAAKGYLTKVTSAQYGNPTAPEKNQWETYMHSQLDANKGKDNFVSPDNAQTALDSWLQLSPSNTVGEFHTKFKQYLNPNTTYPGIQNAPALMTQITRGITSIFAKINPF
jgi:hypothetical protein